MFSGLSGLVEHDVKLFDGMIQDYNDSASGGDKPCQHVPRVILLLPKKMCHHSDTGSGHAISATIS